MRRRDFISLLSAAAVSGLAAAGEATETSDEDANWDHQMARGLIDAVLKAAARNA
jgi:hypothetical protein